MSISNSPIVRNVLLTCMNFKTRKKEAWVHNAFLDKIKRDLEGSGFKVVREYAIAYPGDYKQLYGKIDLYASSKDINVCLEFDFGLHLRYKSIQKMLTSNAHVCVGVYRGINGGIFQTYNNKRLFFENKERIASVKEQFGAGSLGKTFYLINFLNKKISVLHL